MILLAWRQLTFDKIKTLLTVLALSAVIAVILLLQGFESGLYQQLYRTAANLKADLIVTQAGVSSLLGARSALPQLTREEVEAIPGVKMAHPLTTLPAIYDKHQHKMPIFIFIYDIKGGPADFLAGDAGRDARDIVIDESLAKKHALNVGDEFIVAAFSFRIAGITRHRTALFMPFAYISYDGMIDLILESELAPDISTFPLLSFLLVDLTPGAVPQEVIKRIENTITEADVFPTQQLAQNAVRLGEDLFGPVMQLLVAIAYVIGFLVMALIMDADVRSKKRHYGVLRAIGFSSIALTKAIIQQTFLILLVSMPLGLVMAEALSIVIEAMLPLYTIVILEPDTLLQTLLASVAFTVAGALIPLRYLQQVDPLIALQGAA